MTDTIHVRASSLPLASRCAASLVKPEIETDSAEGELGSAVHWMLAKMVHGERPTVDEALNLWPRVDRDELGRLYRAGCFCWPQIQERFPDPWTEMELVAPLDDAEPAVALQGHVDVVDYSQGEIWVADWKSGYLDHDHEEQVRAYCWLAMQAVKLDTARACVIRLRDCAGDYYSYTRDELATWWQARCEQLRRQSLYVAGEHCRWCKRAYECPANRQRLIVGLHVLANDERLHRGEALSGEDLGKLYWHAKAVGDLVEHSLKAIKAQVAGCGGHVPIGNGQALELTEQKQVRILPTSGAMRLLEERIGPERTYACLTIGKTKVLDEVKVQAPPGRGQKTAAVTEIMASLEQVGAVTTNIVQKLEIKRVHDTQAIESTASAPASQAAGEAAG